VGGRGGAAWGAHVVHKEERRVDELMVREEGAAREGGVHRLEPLEVLRLERPVAADEAAQLLLHPLRWRRRGREEAWAWVRRARVRRSPAGVRPRRVAEVMRRTASVLILLSVSLLIASLSIRWGGIGPPLPAESRLEMARATCTPSTR